MMHEVIWAPQDGPQRALIECPIEEVFFGGARGGGKTEGSIGDWLEHSAAYGEASVGVFFRRKYKQLEEVIARTKQIFPKIGASYNEQKSEWAMPGGGRLKFRYLERDSDAEEYQGHSYTRVYIEEVTNFPTAGPINKLRATLRSPKGVPCAIRLTGNPGGPGHHWVKKRFIDPCPQGYKVLEEDFDGIITRRVFIPSKIRDNKLLMTNDPGYVARLKQSGSEALVRAWLEGDWSIIDGAFFSEFSYEKHVLAYGWIDRIPAKALRFRAFDWGSAKPFSVGWYAISDGSWGLPEGALVKYREWYGASGDNKGLKMQAPDVALGIVEREKGEFIRYGAADPAIFIRDGGPSIAEMMAIKGCVWARADNKRVAGWEQLHDRLHGSGGKPLLYFTENCEDTIRTIPLLQHDEGKMEDVDTDGEDHAADETRYAVMSRPWVPKEKPMEVVRFPKLPQEFTINELVARLRRRRVEREEAL